MILLLDILFPVTSSHSGNIRTTGIDFYKWILQSPLDK